MKIAIIGAGISGMSAARLLQDEGFDVTVFEKQAEVGGIARTRETSEGAYHLTGGHCFNSKYAEVLDFVFNKILPKSEWNYIERNAKIDFRGHKIDYPIEYSMRQIAEFDPEIASNMVLDYYATTDEDRKNLNTWFESKFGYTLAHEYFIPYNEKIWKMPGEKMNPDWVEGKLPTPDKVGFTKSLLNGNKDSMPHSTFFYPKSNNQNSFIEALAQRLLIIKNYEVKNIERNANGWKIGDTIFDYVISTAPLDLLPKTLQNMPDKVLESIDNLRYNKVSNMLWTSTSSGETWTYYPDHKTLFHRHIHIGNFFRPRRNITITEAIGAYSYDEMYEAGKAFKYLVEPIDFNISEHAYVVFDENYAEARRNILNYLDELKNFSTLGRFGEWEYFNMDICIKSAMDLCSKIKIHGLNNK